MSESSSPPQTPTETSSHQAATETSPSTVSSISQNPASYIPPSSLEVPSPLRLMLEPTTEAKYLSSFARNIPAQGPSKRVLYFFYGSLMHPPQLASVLNRSRCFSDPAPRPATLSGYKLMLWGQYPTLIPLQKDPELKELAAVKGTVVEIYPHEESKLQYYETKNYRAAEVKIRLEGGEEIMGKTFVWAGKREDIEEGVWTLEKWKRGMGLEDAA